MAKKTFSGLPYEKSRIRRCLGAINTYSSSNQTKGFILEADYIIGAKNSLNPAPT